MRVLVTGGSGFIGTNLISRLVDSPQYEVVNIDIKCPRNDAQRRYWEAIDIRDSKLLDKFFSHFKPEVIVHLAARTDLDGLGIADYDSNTTGVRNIVDCANKSSTLARILFASSMLVCRIGYIPKNEEDYCPTTDYGESKRQGESIVRSQMSSEKAWIIVRPTSLWGPWFDRPYRNFFDAVRSGYYFHPKGFEVKRSYGFVGNSVDQLLELMLTKQGNALGRTFYLCDYVESSLLEWANAIRSASDQTPVKQLPINVLKLIALLGDLSKTLGYKSPPLTSFRLNNMTTDAVFDTQDLFRICGESHYTMTEGVKLTVEWLNQQLRK